MTCREQHGKYQYHHVAMLLAQFHTFRLAALKHPLSHTSPLRKAAGHVTQSTQSPHLIQVRQVELCVLQGSLHRDSAPVQEVAAELLKLGARQVGLNVLGAILGGSDEGQGDAGLAGGGQLDLGLLSCLSQTLQGLQRSACAAVSKLLAWDFSILGRLRWALQGLQVGM